MRPQLRAPFVSLRAFWADLVYDICERRPPAREPGELARVLDAHFSGLTEHSLTSVAARPFVIDCRGCANNRGARRRSACETHVGSLQGILEAALRAPLSLRYEPDERGGCAISVGDRHAAEGAPVVAWLRRAAHVALESGARQWYVVDTRGAERTPVNAWAWRLLELAADGVLVAEVARRLAVEPWFFDRLVRDAERQGWIEVELRPPAVTADQSPAR